jgi:Ala-tRNA(Pro) deacylase
MVDPYNKIISLLKEHNVSFEEVEHEPVYTSEQAAKVRGMSMASGAKSLLLKTDKGFMLTILSGDKRLDSRKLKCYIGAERIRFATSREVEEIMGCKIGACYPFGNLINVKMVVDTSLAENEKISFNPGVHSKSITMTWSDYKKLINPNLASIAE